MQSQQGCLTHADCAVLTLRPNDWQTNPDPDAKTHTIAAVRTQLHNADAWLACDSTKPDSVFHLDSHVVATAFDAEVMFIVTNRPEMNNRFGDTATGYLARKHLQQCCQVAQTTALHAAAVTPLSGTQAAPGVPLEDFSHASQCFMLFAPAATIDCRATFRRQCSEAGLNCIAHAKFRLRKDHLVLTITNQAHLQKLRLDNPPNLQALIHQVRHRTGWRMVAIAPTPQIVRRQHMPATPVVSENPFARLADDHNAPDPEAPRRETQACAAASTSHAPNANANHPTAAVATIPTKIGTLNLNGLTDGNMTAKLHATLDLMEANNIAILAVQETRVTNTLLIDELLTNLNTNEHPYTFIGRPATVHTQTMRARGGHGFIVHPAWKQWLTFRDCVGQPHEYAACWLTIRAHAHRQALHLACVYWPDDGKYSVNPALFRTAAKHLSDSLETVKGAGGTICILGDFNARPGSCSPATTHWPHALLAPRHGEETHKRNPQGKTLLALCARHGMHFASAQTLSGSGPTFRRNGTGGNVSQSQIDHIILSTSEEQTPAYANTLPYNDILVAACKTDHCPVIIDLLSAASPITERRQTIRRPKLERLRDAESATAYRQHFSDHTHVWSQLMTDMAHRPKQERIDSISAHLTGTINAATESALGYREMVAGRNITKRWRRQSTARLIEKRRTAAAQFKRHPSHTNQQRLAQLREQTASALKSDWQEHRARRTNTINQRFRSHTSPKEMHNCIKSACRLQTHRASPTAVRDPDTDKMEDQPQGVAQAYANFIQKLCTDHVAGERGARAQAAATRVQTIASNLAAQPEGDYEHDTPITQAEVASRLRAMKHNKAPGLDAIPAELLQASGKDGLAMITDILNIAYTDGIIPSHWRIGNISPVFKKGDRSECGNYRPITLLRTLDKLYAAVLAQRLDNALHDHPEQYGFCKSKGTAESHFNLVAAIEHALAQGKQLFLASLDIKKAFDEVCRALKLVNLYDRGVRGKLWLAIKALYNHTQAVVSVAGAVSAPFDIMKGVAQGCPASPKLFNTYVLPMLEALDLIAPIHGVIIPGSHPGSTTPKTTCGSMFADDSKGIASSVQSFQAVVETMRHSVGLLNMEDAPHKTAWMCFQNTHDPKHHPVQQMTFGGHAVRPSMVLKDLGLRFQPNLDWTAQINAVISSGSNGLYSYAKELLNPQLDIGPKRLIIQTHILSKMKYGMETWYPNTTQAKQAFKDAEQILTKTLRCALGVYYKRRNLLLSRFIKADVLMADLAIPNLDTEHRAARIRFAYKHDPLGSFATCQPPQGEEAGPSLASLPSVKYTAGLERERRRTTAQLQGAQGDPSELEQAPENRPSNLDITASLHAQCLLHRYHERVPLERGGDAGRRHTHNLRAPRTILQPLTNYHKLVYKAVFRERLGTVELRHKPACLSYMSYLQSHNQRAVIAIAALRSGHLPDEMYETTLVVDGGEKSQWLHNVTTHEGTCSACGQLMMHYPEHTQISSHELPWLLIVHRLLDCEAVQTTVGPNTRPEALSTFCHSLRAAAQPHDAFAAYANNLVHALSHERGNVSTRERLLSFLICPTHTGGVPRTLQQHVMAIAAALVWGDVDPVALDQPPAEGAEADAPPG